MNIRLHLRRLETIDGDHKHMFTMLTEGINQERRRVILYRLLYNQRSPPWWSLQRMQVEDTYCIGFTFQNGNNKTQPPELPKRHQQRFFLTAKVVLKRSKRCVF